MPAHFLQRDRIREYIEIPSIAWPTIWLAFSCAFTQLILCILHAKGYISTAFVFPLSSLNIFMSFTPLHEAVHGSIAQCVLPGKRSHSSREENTFIDKSRTNEIIYDDSDNVDLFMSKRKKNHNDGTFHDKDVDHANALKEISKNVQDFKQFENLSTTKHYPNSEDTRTKPFDSIMANDDESTSSEATDSVTNISRDSLRNTKRNSHDRFFYPSSLNMFDVYYTTRLRQQDYKKYSNFSPMSKLSSICYFWLNGNYQNLPFVSRASFRILHWRNMCVKFHQRVLKFLQRIYSELSFTILRHIRKRKIIYKVYLNKFINQFIGGLCATILCQCYLPFQYIHLRHHRHTNETELDPDIWASRGPWYILPFKWLTIEAFYWYYYLLRLNTRPLYEWTFSLVNLFILYGTVYYLCQLGYTKTLLYSWILPGYFAKGILSYSFDYLPHRYDHNRHAESEISNKNSHQVLSIKKKRKITRAENEYLATSIVALYESQISCLTIPFLYQNYHSIHHLAPYVPFYQYEIIWNHIKDELLENGTQIIPIIPDVDKTLQKEKSVKSH